MASSTTAVEQSSTREPVPEMVVVRKDDLVLAWLGLERLVVGLHRIGSYYSTPSAEVGLAPAQHAEMLEEIARLLDHDFYRKLGKARVTLSRYLPNDEAETLSDGLDYYQPTGPSTPTK